MLKSNSFKHSLITIFFLFAAFVAYGAPGDIPPAVLDALKTGNSVQLSKYFNTSIELAIPGKEDIYSNKQAELIIRDFFAKHVPSNFSVLHKGGKEGSQYAIGNLTTSAGNFRVTILIKLKDGSPFIHQLRFEEENAD
ncbi:MAG TPA: DUF4783 domain-containing protein [Bacteroidales bacterium]|nr:DUF4783 domain-containing protein [Bacteroidales bacterium]